MLRFLSPPRPTLKLVLVCLAGLVTGTGCTEPWEPWGMAPAASPSQAAQPSAPPRQLPDAKPQARVSEPSSGLLQVVLVSEPAPPQPPPGLEYVRLEHATARQVGQVVAWLYLPTGASGATHRYTLLYGSEKELHAAAAWARALDLPPLSEGEISETASPAEYFLFAVRLIYGLKQDDPKLTDRLRLADVSLTRVLAAEQQPEPQRWAAGMIAGALLADHLFDYEQAAQRLHAAASTAPPGSLEQMTAAYVLSQLHIQNGHPREARSLLSVVVKGEKTFDDTEVFQRAQRKLAELKP